MHDLIKEALRNATRLCVPIAGPSADLVISAYLRGAFDPKRHALWLGDNRRDHADIYLAIRDNAEEFFREVNTVDVWHDGDPDEAVQCADDLLRLGLGSPWPALLWAASRRFAPTPLEEIARAHLALKGCRVERWPLERWAKTDELGEGTVALIDVNHLPVDETGFAARVAASWAERDASVVLIGADSTAVRAYWPTATLVEDARACILTANGHPTPVDGSTLRCVASRI